MTEIVFEAIRTAVTIARNENVRRVSFLRRRLSQEGFDKATIDSALVYWANKA